MLVKWLLFFSFWAGWLTAAKSEEIQWHLFHQTDYDLKVHRIEGIWYNRSYFSYVKVDYALYNRTYRAFVGSLNLLLDVGNDIRVDIQAYKMMSNEYRFFPVTASLDVCKEVDRNSFDLKAILQKTSNITGCPMNKGYYYLHNAVLDYSRFPPFMPHGDYKMEIKFYHQENYLGECDTYYAISGKPLLPKL